jgi:transposase-like protein
MHFICDDCTFLFRVYADKNRMGLGQNKPFYCPNCGDNFAVSEYKENKTKTEYKRIHWTKKEIEQLKKYVDKGVPRHQIALLLGRSYDSVKGKIDRQRYK